MLRPYYKKILKYWKTSQGDPERTPFKLEVDVTELRCEEDNQSFRLLDETGRVVAEFGPGQQYDGWTLTVEYPSPSL
jgi:hypothetical protein